jgi:hypothetical protein
MKDFSVHVWPKSPSFTASSTEPDFGSQYAFSVSGRRRKPFQWVGDRGVRALRGKGDLIAR